jgi:capsular exopolysaccharide synthesis family protein
LSKLFDALSKTQGEAASLALPLIHKAGAAGPGTGRDLHVDAPQIVSYPGELRREHKQFHVEDVPVENLARVVFHTDPTGTAADRFRLLRMRLREAWTAGKLKSVLVTSPLSGDGKTITALNLATALTEERMRKVLLIEADLHRGYLDQQLALSSHIGLAECLQHGLDPLSAIRRIEPLGWYLLSAGRFSAGSPTELLHPQELNTLFQKVSPQFDWIVIDSPPVLPLSDAVALRHHADGVLMVAKAACTSMKAVEDAMARLGKRHILGLLLNGIEKLDQPYSRYYQYQRHKTATLRDIDPSSNS